MSTFVLIHGAWHGGWCWRDVAALLRAQGHSVFAPSLSGMGEHAHLISRQITLDTHVDAVAALFEIEDLSDVVLVGHSYGGLIITGVADRLQARASERGTPHPVRHLVYLDALVPQDGDRWDSFHTPEQQIARHASAQAAGGIWLPNPDAAVFGLPDATQRAWVTRNLRPHPYGTYLSRLALPRIATLKLPRTYVDCVTPLYSDFNGLKPRLKADPAWHYVTLETGHDCMVSAPEATAEVLEKCASPV